MPGMDTKALPPASHGEMTTPLEEKKPACKACCACPETKKVRDECLMENGEMNCQHLIEAHKSFVPRELSAEELLQLAKHDLRPVPDSKRRVIEKDVCKNWDRFYKRNGNRFFKQRHWITRECDELADSDTSLRLLELGCGVGDLVFPLMEENPKLFAYACDFSPTAIDILRSHEKYSCGRIQAFVADLTNEEDLTKSVTDAPDIATLIFVLSAVNPSKMSLVLRNIRKVLRPGSLVFFRDYGVFDHAMIRFAPGHKLSDRFYYRQDGTYSYFFSTEEVSKLFAQEGFTVEVCEYVYRETVNRKEELCVPRIFVQGKFRVPECSCSR